MQSTQMLTTTLWNDGIPRLGNLDILINPDYAALSIPKDDASYAVLESDCCINGIIQPLIVDEKGYVIDGMHRYRIAQEQELSFDVKVKTFHNEEAKRQWICLQSMLQKKYTKIQGNLSRHNMMKLENGTVQSRAEKLANKYREPGVKFSTTVARYKTCWFYGEKLTGDSLISGIYDFARSGGSVLLRDLNELSKLPKKEQQVALSERKKTSRPWKECIRHARHQCVSAARGALLDDVAIAKKSVGSLNRYIRELSGSTHAEDVELIQKLGAKLEPLMKILPKAYKLLSSTEKKLK